MDGGRENRFFAGGAEISRRGGGMTAAPVRTKPRIVAKRVLSWYSDIEKHNVFEKEAVKCLF